MTVLPHGHGQLDGGILATPPIPVISGPLDLADYGALDSGIAASAIAALFWIIPVIKDIHAEQPHCF